VTVPKRIPYSSNHAIKGQRGHTRQARHMQKEPMSSAKPNRRYRTRGPARNTRWKTGQLFETLQQRCKDEQKKTLVRYSWQSSSATVNG